MRILSLGLALALSVATAALGQRTSTGTSSVNRPNSSNFGWQDRQRSADETRDAYAQELASLTDAQWREAALAMLEFESGDQNLLLSEAMRIGAAKADRKAVTEEGEYSRKDRPSWVVKFGKKTPKKLTLTLTDPNSTEVNCTVDELLESGQGYVGIFVQDGVVMCLVRPAEIG